MWFCLCFSLFVTLFFFFFMVAFLVVVDVDDVVGCCCSKGCRQPKPIKDPHHFSQGGVRQDLASFASTSRVPPCRASLYP